MCQRSALHWGDVYAAERAVNTGKPEITMAELNQFFFYRFCSQTQPQTWIQTWVSWLIKEFKYPAVWTGTKKRSIWRLRRQEKEKIISTDDLHQFSKGRGCDTWSKLIQSEDRKWRKQREMIQKAQTLDIHETVASSLFLGSAAWRL